MRGSRAWIRGGFWLAADLTPGGGGDCMIWVMRRMMEGAGFTHTEERSELIESATYSPNIDMYSFSMR